MTRVPGVFRDTLPLVHLCCYELVVIIIWLQITMVRTCVRKTPAVDGEKLKKAISAVLNDGFSVRNAAKQFGVGRMSLSRHCEAADHQNITITLPSQSSQSL